MSNDRIERSDIAEAMRDVLAEIREDQEAGKVPDSVDSFGTLHDFVDANEYGGFCDDSNPRSGWPVAAINAVQEGVNAILHNTPLRFHLHERVTDYLSGLAYHSEDERYHYWTAYRKSDGALFVLSFDGGDEWCVCQYPEGATLDTLDRFDGLRSHFVDGSEDPANVFEYAFWAW